MTSMCLRAKQKTLPLSQSFLCTSLSWGHTKFNIILKYQTKNGECIPVTCSNFIQVASTGKKNLNENPPTGKAKTQPKGLLIVL